MNINVEHQPNCRAVAHIRVPGEEVAKHRQSITSYFAQNVRLPGYRPGKAPAAAVQKRFAADIDEELEKRLVSDGLRQAVKNEGLDVLNVLAVKDKRIHDGDHSFSFTVEMSLVPRFDLPEYKGIQVKLPRIQITEADVDHFLLHLREERAKFEDAGRPAQFGDAVVLSYEASVDGQPMVDAFPDAPEHLHFLRDQWFLLQEEEDFLPGFYAGLLGISAGETRQLSGPMGEEFSFEPLRGKTLDLEISCSAVKVKRVPEFDDEFVKQLSPDLTREDLLAEVRENIRRRRSQANDQAKANQVIAHIFERVEFDLPQDLVNREAQRRTNDYARRALQSGVNQEDLIKHQDEIVGSATQQARQSVKVSFILEQVARKEGLSVSEQQLAYALAEMASRQQIPVKKFLAEAQRSGLVDRVREDLLLDVALQFLKDHAQVEETEPEPELCDQHPQPGQDA